MKNNLIYSRPYLPPTKVPTGQPFSDISATDLCCSYLGVSGAHPHQSSTTRGKSWLFFPSWCTCWYQACTSTPCRGSTSCLAAALAGGSLHLKLIWATSDNKVLTNNIPDRSHYISTFTASSWESEHVILAAHRLRCRVESWLQMCATSPINRGTSGVQPSTWNPPAPLKSLAGHTACTASDRSVTAGACYPVVF